MIDTHAHINFNGFKEDGDEAVARALKAKIWVINVGAQYATSKRAVAYARQYDVGVYAAVGLHPGHVYRKTTAEVGWKRGAEEKEFEELDEEKYRRLIKNEKVVAVGEIGLDYYDGMAEEEKTVQKDVFVRQLELAQQAGKPVMIHCRRAYDDLIEILKMFNFVCSHCPHACAPGLRGVIHSFMGRQSQAEKLVEMGFYLSFNGIITYARDYDKVINALSLENILLETDCPWLTPVPHRSERNEPAYVKYVAEKIAEVKGMSLEQVAKQTTQNARQLFGI